MEIRETFSRVRTVTPLIPGSKTEQGHAGSSNINTIMAKYRRSGLLPVVASGAPATFGDFTSADDYQSCLNRVQDANSRFYKLPSEIRAVFDNNPAKLLEFLANDLNRDKAVELGLVEKTTPVTPETEIVNP